jgi:hypothetical protein
MISNDPQEATYPNTSVDIDGKPLDGAQKYTMTFTHDQMPKVGAFWSLTMYDLIDNLVKNSENYCITSLNATYKPEPDESLILYI